MGTGRRPRFRRNLLRQQDLGWKWPEPGYIFGEGPIFSLRCRRRCPIIEPAYQTESRVHTRFGVVGVVTQSPFVSQFLRVALT